MMALDANPLPKEVLSHVVRIIGPDLGITGSAVFLLAWSDFVISSFFLPPGESTVSQVLASKQSFLGTQWGPLGAAVLVSIVPVVLGIAAMSGALAQRKRFRYEL